MPPKRPASAQDRRTKQQRPASNASINGPPDCTFQFKTKKVSEYGSDLKKISGVAKLAGSTVGTLEGALVSRPSRHNFMEVCDESQELTDLAMSFCNEDGFVRLDIPGIQSPVEQERASVGGFLQIEAVSIHESHRRKDVGINFVEALLRWLHGQWSLCALHSAPLYVRDPYEDHPAVLEMKMQSGAVPLHLRAEIQASIDNKRKESTQITQKLAKHWMRLGFQQKHRGSNLLFLVPEKLKLMPKSESQDEVEVAMPAVQEQLSAVNEKLVQLVQKPATDEIYTASARKLISEGADINKSNAMHYAAANGQLNALRTLKALGGDVNHKDGGQNTPLHVASSVPTLPHEVIAALLSFGASVTVADNEGRRPAKNFLQIIQSGLAVQAAFNLQISSAAASSNEEKKRTLLALLTEEERATLRRRGMGLASSLPELAPQIERVLFESSAAENR